MGPSVSRVSAIGTSGLFRERAHAWFTKSTAAIRVRLLCGDDPDEGQEPRHVTVADDELASSRKRLRHRSRDLHGARLGDLLGEAIVSTDQYGHLWRFQCLGCGVKVYSHAAKIRQRFSVLGAKLACRDCMKQEKTTRRHEVSMWFFREMWECYRSLYDSGYTDRVRIEILDELCAKIAPTHPETHPADSTWTLSDVETSRPRSRQMAAYLYPLNIGDDRVIRCVECGKDYARALGCVLCLGPVCANCAREEKHCCLAGLDTDVATYDVVGRDFDLSRERVRQVQESAFRKFLCYESPLNEDIDMLDSKNRERKYRLRNPKKCWCGQRLAGGMYCSSKHQEFAAMKELRLKTQAEIVKERADAAAAKRVLAAIETQKQLAEMAAERVRQKARTDMTIYEIYDANNFRVDFWAWHPSCPTHVFHVVKVGFHYSGPLYGESTRSVVQVKIYDRTTGERLCKGEMKSPDAPEYTWLDTPPWAVI